MKAKQRGWDGAGSRHALGCSTGGAACCKAADPRTRGPSQTSRCHAAVPGAPAQVAVPGGHVLVCEARGHVKHDDGALAVDVVAVAQAAKLFLQGRGAAKGGRGSHTHKRRKPSCNAPPQVSYTGATLSWQIAGQAVMRRVSSWAAGTAHLPRSVPAVKANLAAVGGEVQGVHLHANGGCSTSSNTRGSSGSWRPTCQQAGLGLQAQAFTEAGRRAAGGEGKQQSGSARRREASRRPGLHSRSYFFSNSPVRWRFTKVVLPAGGGAQGEGRRGCRNAEHSRWAGCARQKQPGEQLATTGRPVWQRRHYAKGRLQASHQCRHRLQEAREQAT